MDLSTEKTAAYWLDRAIAFEAEEGRARSAELALKRAIKLDIDDHDGDGPKSLPRDAA